MVTRRRFLQIGGMAGAALLLPHKWIRRAVADPIAGGTLPPQEIPKFARPLVIPPAMPRTKRFADRGQLVDYYEIAVRQFQQEILPPPFAPTTVWGYGSLHSPGTVLQGGSFNYPSFSIEARWQTPVRVKWVNDLVDANRNYLPHLLPVDQTLHWANPGGGLDMRDMRCSFSETPGPYQGPVPFVTHVHGAHVPPYSDGFPEAWYLPNAVNIPDGFATEGTYYNEFRTQFLARRDIAWDPGSATFEYPNDQRATTLWYHDHSLGITRLNVYAGPAGFYNLRGGPDDVVLDKRGRPAVLPGPAPALGDPRGTDYYELPIVIQDRSFNEDGSLFYPENREFFDGATSEDPGYIPHGDLAQLWNPEVFGNAMVVNGRTWPFLDVRQRRYRFRLLNGCNSRFLLLQFDHDLPFWQIGAEGGFLPAPVPRTRLLLAPAERADVIVDFSGIRRGTEIRLLNVGPDEPFGGGEPGEDFEGSDEESTGEVMLFRVGNPGGGDHTTPPDQLVLPARTPLPAESSVRRVSLNEEMSMTGWDGPAAAMLGAMNGVVPTPKMWMEEVTETPSVGTTEVWEIHNFTEDAHPIHLHQVEFEVVNREGLVAEGEVVTGVPNGEIRGPEAWETGTKDTVIAYPGEVTRIRAHFDIAGLYVWHCHILEHEDNEMMRPLKVMP
jgi:spore coat protein A